MRARSATRLTLIVLLAGGFVYAGAATARRYRDIYRTPVPRSTSASIDAHLAPAHIAGADALRRAVIRAGWPPGEDVVVLARASTFTRAELYQVFHATGYLLYPRRVSVAAWCDERATPAQCQALDAQGVKSAIARHGARRVLLIGGENRFPFAYSARLSDMAALVSLLP
ncbi:MAG TPA: hypothetical protein VM115_11740 [Vicinamibacterales bacterium]|nr:hypothetical protein [Vicinamibacterales bacterium]